MWSRRGPRRERIRPATVTRWARFGTGARSKFVSTGITFEKRVLPVRFSNGKKTESHLFGVQSSASWTSFVIRLVMLNR